MNMVYQLDRSKIMEVFSDSMKRPFLFVYPETKLRQVATFLAIGPQIYVDGLVVVTEPNKGSNGRVQTPIGRIGARSILSTLLAYSFDDLEDFSLQLTASQVMEIIDENDCVDLNSTIRDVIEIFKRTRFGFVLVTKLATVENEYYHKKATTVIGIITIRDFLPLLAHKTINVDNDEYEKITLDQISSELISVDKNTSIRKSISIMLEKGIRNIGVKDFPSFNDMCTDKKDKHHHPPGHLCIANDRKIMEFLFSQKGRRTIDTSFGTFSNLDLNQVLETRNDLSLREGARQLMNVEVPYLILEGRERIVTPWNIIMESIGKLE